MGEDGREVMAGSVVLLVDPDDATAAPLTAALSERNIAVCRAVSSSEAKLMARDLAPDVIVLELALPDGDGLVVCADLKTRSSAPVIVYTSRDARERVL